MLLRPERNGYIYVVDRTSGEVLTADPYVHITSSKGVDLKTGRLIPVSEKNRTGIVVREICPAARFEDEVRTLTGGDAHRGRDRIRQIQHPRAHDEKTAMPEMGVTERDSRDITAYLYTLR